MSFIRGRRCLFAAAVGAVLTVVGGCAPGGSDTAAASAPSSAGASSPSAAVRRPLSAAELAAALPKDGTLPGYDVNSEPETETAGDESAESVRPAACEPLDNARSGIFTDSVASAWVHISALKFAPPDETLTFTSYRSGGAAAHFAALAKALDACPSLSLPNRFGGRVSVDVTRVKDNAPAGDASVSFRMHWSARTGGPKDAYKTDTEILVTTVRSGEATLTVVSDIGFASQLSDAKKHAFIPKIDQQLLKRQADALSAAQRS
ncbi:hypothetical protein ACFY2T_29560 [Streptomyces sp. NPDC001260]|uniref:hypothetical protein n=1 Tax=Streptomyces sp. NPDC001260 TaxID=3364551 RepID=UPI0036C459EE